MNYKRICKFALIMICVMAMYVIDVKAEQADSTKQVIAEKADIVIEVKGMVCSFCAQGIQKSFEKQKSIHAVSVNLTDKTVQLKLKKEARISDQEIDLIIKNAGYNIGKISRQ